MIKLSLQSLCYRDTFNAGKITMLEIIDKAAEYRMDGVDLHFTHFAFQSLGERTPIVHRFGLLHAETRPS